MEQEGMEEACKGPEPEVAIEQGLVEPDAGFQLSPQQSAAINTIINTSKRVVILTGPAGSGKSTITNHLRNTDQWCMSATTGKAAMHIEGVTIDRLFSIDRSDWSVRNQSTLDRNMACCQPNIATDEASMVGKRMGDLIAQIIGRYRKKLLLVGDWAQASPVKDDPILSSKLLSDFEFIKLTENHRQADGPYLGALNKVRVGVVDKSVEDVFLSRSCDTPPDDDQFIRMYATNYMTNRYNNARLWRHVSDTKAPYFKIFSEFVDGRPAHIQEKWPRDDGFKSKALQSSAFGHDEPLAVGCRVVITSNDYLDFSYVNGDTGTITGAVTSDGRNIKEAVDDYNQSKRPFEINKLVVILDRNNTETHIRVCKRSVFLPTTSRNPETGRLEQDVDYSVKGLPVKLGYAITVHKAQGMTVDKAWFDMSSLTQFPDRESIHGLAYVALSRTRTLSGLLIGGWDKRLIYCSDGIRELL